MQLRALIFGAAVVAASLSGVTSAATGPPAEAVPSTCNLRIDPQSLDTALQELARQCGVQTVYFSEITHGLTAPGVNGVYSIDAALHRLLDPAGLVFRRIDAVTIEIARAEAKSPARQPATATKASARAGSDKTHTSAGTGPPVPEITIIGTAEGLVATRTETPLQDIPQTVSIIPAEQIRQQNNVNVGDALADAVGVTVVQQDSVNRAFYSRGFPITNYTLDGGASLHSLLLTAGNTIDPFFQVPDLSEFDRIEVLRGSDALFGADGAPGGTLNLVRKRPLEEARLTFSSSVGSWSDYREEIDATGPLGFAGTLRGRVDATFARQNYFYDGANDQHESVFAVVEDDLTPYTTLTAGGSYRWENARLFAGGLPQFSEGGDVGLPRGTSFTFDWGRFDTQTREGYLRLDQQIQGTWHLQLNAVWVSGSVKLAYGEFMGPVAPITHALADPATDQYTPAPGEHDQLSGEITVTGHEVWLGIPVDMAFGGDHTHATTSLTLGATGPFGPPLSNVYAFNPALYPSPIPSTGVPYASGEASSELQSGLFASLKAQLAQPLFVTAGLRVSNEKIMTTYTSIFGGTFVTPTGYDYVGKLTPFVATEFRLNDTYSIYASYADIYQSNQGFVTQQGKRLSPIDGIDIEGGVKGAWRDGKLHGALTVYKIVQRGLPAFDISNVLALSNVCCYYPSAKSKSQGVDLELNGNLTPGWLIGGGYSYNNTSETPNAPDPNGDFESPWTPRHLLKMWTSTRLPGSWQHWTAGATLLAQSSNFSHSFSCPTAYTGECLSGFEPINSVQHSYAVIDPRIGYRFNEHWQLALTINNVFDKHYYQTIGTPTGGSWYGDPRNYLLRLDAQL